jgi:hypothetical protein
MNYQLVNKVKRERDSIPARYCAVAIICGLILLAGFFFAAKQHFAGIDYGFKSSELQKEKQKIEAEQRRLRATRESAQSPPEIEKAAQKIGLVRFSTKDFEGDLESAEQAAAQPAPTEKETSGKPGNNKAEKAASAKPAQENPDEKPETKQPAKAEAKNDKQQQKTTEGKANNSGDKVRDQKQPRTASAPAAKSDKN